jgi:hypothetical protein
VQLIVLLKDSIPLLPTNVKLVNQEQNHVLLQVMFLTVSLDMLNQTINVFNVELEHQIVMKKLQNLVKMDTS